MLAHIIAIVTGAILSVGGLIPEATLAQDDVRPIGKVVTAKGAVTVEHVGAVVIQAAFGNRADYAHVSDPIYRGDIVATGPDGQVGIAFADGTAFNLSSNARMAMTEFVYDPNSTSNSTLLSLTKGTFTFVAGKVAKTGDMKVDTPVATMGIRGTTPRVEISEDGTVKFSTLIEEGNQRGSQGAGTLKESEPNLNICRGC